MGGMMDSTTAGSMTIGGNAMAVTGTTTTRTCNCTNWPNCNCCSRFYVYPYSNYYFHTVQEPSTCIGKAHVFECDHVPTCKCGKIRRILPKPKKTKG